MKANRRDFIKTAGLGTPGPGPANQTVTVNLTGAPGNPLSNTKLFLRVVATTP